VRSATAIAADIRAGRRTAVHELEEALSRLERAKPLNCVSVLLSDRAFARAGDIDGALARGEDGGPLCGVPFVAKDLFDVAGLATLAGSRINRDREVAAEDAVSVRRMESAGAILIATTTMDEYAYGYTSENSHTGPARNPHDPSRTPGGSSGGSAALVAAGVVPLALGTDTNGSIRVPAALSGCFGLKPTFGRLSRRGAFPFVASLDHVGLLASSVTDLAVGYDALQGPDHLDPACANRPVEPCAPSVQSTAGALSVAIADGYFLESLEPDVRFAVERAATILGARERVSIPEAERARAAGFVITATEAGNLHRENLSKRPFDFDPLIRDRLLAGALVPAQWYLQAQRFRRWFADKLSRLLREVELILLPATPCAAPANCAEALVIGGRTLPARLALGTFVQPMTIAGVPIAVAPTCGANGMPVGIQLVARAGREDLVLRAAGILERSGFAEGLGLAAAEVCHARH
jgi:AtzE family amidohydrolase